MPLEFEKVSPYIVDIDEGKFLMDIMLGNVDVEMIVSILIETTLLGSWPNV